MRSTSNQTGSFDANDETWYSALYEEMFESLIRCSTRITRQEIEAEEIVWRCLSALPGLVIKDPQKFQTLQHVKSFLYRIVMNASIDCQRSGKVGLIINYDLEQLENLDTEKLTSELEEEDMHQKLLYWADQLPPKSKEIIDLFFYENMSLEEIANKLGQPIGSIYTAKYRAIEQLRKMAKSKEQPLSPDTVIILFWMYLMTP